MNERLEARVEGRVQGVSFRHHIRKKARELGIQGWVRNEHDGSVQVRAEGPREKLDLLLAHMQQGPEGCRVEDVEVEWRPHQGDLGAFSVAH